MKKNVLKSMAMVFLLLALFLLPACSSGSGDNERLTALEAEVKSLKAEAQAREAHFKKELTQIRKNLEGIRGLIEIEQGRSGSLSTPQADADSGNKLDQEIDEKAKSFVSENLDRLLDITKKLLDKMEQELDKQMVEPAPKPKGEEI